MTRWQYILYNVGMEGTEDPTRKTIVVTMTTDMHQALIELAPLHGATVAGLTRALLAKWLEEQGRPVDWVIPWGGRRARPSSPPPE